MAGYSSYHPFAHPWLEATNYHADPTFHHPHADSTAALYDGCGDEYFHQIPPPFGIVRREQSPDPTCLGVDHSFFLENAWAENPFDSVRFDEPYAEPMCPQKINRRSSPMETVSSSSSSQNSITAFGERNAYESQASPLSFFPDMDDLALAGFPFSQESTDMSSYQLDTTGVALREIQPPLDDDGVTAELQGLELKLGGNAFRRVPYYDLDSRAIYEAGYRHPSPHYESPFSTPSDTDSDYVSVQPKRDRTSQLAKSSKVTKQSPARGSHRRRRQNRQLLAEVTVKAHKDPSALSNSSSSNIHDKPRGFSCPLTPYGCVATFSSKNEWKRHFLSQHLCLGFWRCDLCRDPDDSPNDFNRKDLFTQHLRRMHLDRLEIPGSSVHGPPVGLKGRTARPARMSTSTSTSTSAPTPDSCAASPTPTSASPLASSDPLALTTTRCWVPVRSGPSTAHCVFCDARFASKKCNEEWLEHVGKHLLEWARDGKKNVEDIPWARDEVLRAWLVDEGLIEAVGAPGDGQQWRMVDADDLVDMRARAILRKMKGAGAVENENDGNTDTGEGYK